MRVLLALIFMHYAYSLGAPYQPNSNSHKIIYLISPPRSLSTVFLRMMHNRSDFVIMNEPAQYACVKDVHPQFAQTHHIPEISTPSFENVKNIIIQKSESQNVFVKEIAFVIKDHILQEYDFVHLPHIHFVFLLRNPHHTIISEYTKCSQDLRNNISRDIIGYHDVLEIIQMIDACALNKPYIIYTEDLYNNPQETIQRFCEHVDIPFAQEHLHWQSLGIHFDGHEEWHETKYKDKTHHWHGDAIMSTAFQKPTSYMVDKHGNPTFEEIKNPDHREACKKIYAEQLPYYQAIKEYQFKERPLAG